MKTCPKCGLTGVPFGSNTSRPDGLSYYCLPCTRKRHTDKQAARTPEETEAAKLRLVAGKKKWSGQR